MINPVYKYVAKKTRQSWKSNDDKRNAELNLPDNVKFLDNISYGPLGEDNLLSIAKPLDSNGNLINKDLPCIVNIHGGGFFYGDKDVYRFYTAELCKRGFIVITFNYRLCPEHKYPAALSDINTLMKWLEKNAEEYGINKEKITMIGDSAGGNLSLSYCCMLTNSKYADLFGFDLPNLNIKAVCLNCSYNNLLQATDRQSRFLNKVYAGGPLRFTKNKNRMDVQSYLTKDFPPVYMISAPNDFLLYQQQPQFIQFEELGVECYLKIYGTKEDKKACHVFNLDPRLGFSIQANDDIADFFYKKCNS